MRVRAAPTSATSAAQASSGQRRGRIAGHRVERALDLRQLRLHARERLAEEPERLEQAHGVRADAARRTEVDDLDRQAAADAIEPPDALFDDRRFPRQVEQDEPTAELEVAPFAAGLGRDEQAGAVRLAEPRHLDVAPRRRQLLVKDAGRQLRAVAERRAQHLQRLAMRDEHERLLARVAPARRLREQPLDARIRRVHRLRLIAQRALVGAQHGGQRRARGERAADAVDLLPARHGVRRAAARTAASTRLAEAPARGDRRASIGTPTRGGSPPMSTRRVELVHGGSGVPRGEARLEADVLGKLLRPQQLQQPEEAVRVVFERRRAEQQHVAAEGGDRRDRAPRRFAGMSGRAPQALRFVHDQQVDAGLDRLLGQLRVGRSASRGRSPRGGAPRTD